MKLIGIVGRAYYNRENKPIFQLLETMRRACAGQSDIAQVELLPDGDVNYLEIEPGTDPFDRQKLDFVLDKCDGFIVPGGSSCFQFDEYIIQHAVEHDKPLLAICLGFQLLCHHFDSDRPALQADYNPLPRTDHIQRKPYFLTMTKIPDGSHKGEADEYKHNVEITVGSQLHQILGSDKIPVNSLHEHRVDEIARPLIVNAVADDGVLEGVELPDKKFIIGLQWHPEGIRDEFSHKIFDAFADVVRSTND